MNNKRSYHYFFIILALVCAFKQAFPQLSDGGIPSGFKFAPADNLPMVLMPLVNVDSLLQEDSIDNLYKDRPYRFGYNHLVNYNPANSGTWTTLANGNRIWQLDVKSLGAYTLNFAFSNFYMPPGAKLFIYSKNQSQVLGGFTSKTNAADKFFGSELINSDEAVIEYDEPAAVRGQGTFILFRITHGYKDLYNDLFRSFGQAGSCINNINCPQYAAYTSQKRAVVCVIVGSNALCSGTLVNDVPSDGAPYILTANHCGPADGTWVFRFNWEAPGCPDPPASPSYQSIAQGTTVANNALSDFNLVKMSQAPPDSFHVFYAGWTRSTIPATSVTCIHHPMGDIKKCSQAVNPVTATSYDFNYGPAQVWQIGQWTDGATEPGSSGSPLFDENKRIVGQLYGGTSACGETDSELTDYYGRFNVSWDTGTTPQTRLRDWLDPGSTGPMTNDGYDPNPPVNTLGLAVTGISAPNDTSCGNIIYPVITVQNLGSKTVYYFTVKYHVDSNPDTTFIYQSDSLVYFQTLFINLPDLPITAGNHIFFVNVSLPNDSVNQNEVGDAISGAFTIINEIGQATPFSQGFEGDTFPPAGWSITTPLSGLTWQQDTVGAYGLSNSSAAVNEFVNSIVGEKPELITPFIDLSNLSPLPAWLSFDVANARFDSTFYDSLAVLVSTNCGVNWVRIYAKGGFSLATAPDDTNAFVPTPSQWRTDSINISNLAGQPSVQFAFQLISGYGNITYLDNIDIADTSGLSGINNLAGNFPVKVFPNPFNSAFTVQFNLPETNYITMNLYSIEGKLLKQVLNNILTGAGTHQIEINVNQLSAGIYLLQLNNQFLKLEKE